MSITVNKPHNTNYLQPTKFLLTFSEISDTVFFCQQVNLPGVTVNEVTQPSPHVSLYKPGTKITYSPLNINFLVNEELTAWTLIHDWMRSNSIDEKYRKTKVDAVLTILSNMNNPKMRIKFHNVFPTTLTDVSFDTTLSAESHLSSSASFRFDYYDIELIN